MRKPIRSQPLAKVKFTVQNLSHEGRGVALYGSEIEHDVEKVGKKVFIRFALPEETVLAQLTKTHKRYEEADAIEVLGAPSPDRVEPFCPHFGICGGCAMQHIAVDRQIVMKQQVLVSHLEHFAGLSPEQWLEPIRSTPLHYRRRARLGVRWLEKSQQLVLGFRENKTNHLVAIRECKILDQRVSDQLQSLTKVLSSLKNKSAITHIEFALGDDDVSLSIRNMSAFDQQDTEKLLDFVRKRGWQLYFIPDRYQTLQRIDDPNAIMRLSYALPALDLKLVFSPLDFTQVNAEVNTQMITLACDLLDLQSGESVLDLFCGLGNFSFALARCVGETGKIVAVEGVESMVLRGQENAKNNGIEHVEFYAQDLSVDFSRQSWAQQGFDAILIDPPRAGAEQVMEYIANFSAQRIVYVSCDPATLARDAGILVQHGYRLVKAAVMDMFTHTEHVESITLFEKIQVIDPQG